MAEPTGTKTPELPLAPGVAANGTAGPPAPLPPGPDAAQSAIRLGGIKGGRPRKDKLVPGSPEALEADKKRNAERMRNARSLTPPPPLPSELPPGAGAAAPASPNAPGVAGPAPVAADPNFVAWVGDDLRPLIEELAETTEMVMVSKVKKKVAEASLPSVVAKEIEDKAAWDPIAKKGLMISAPEVAAKTMNRLGVSAKYKHEVLCVGALGRIFGGYSLLMLRLDELIEKAGQLKKPEPNPEEKK